MPLRTAIERRYQQTTPEVATLRERLIKVCQSYVDDGLGDSNAEQRLCSADVATYWQQLSEVLVAYQLTSAGIRFIHQNVGPDFRIDHGGNRIWIEVITPTATNRLLKKSSGLAGEA